MNAQISEISNGYLVIVAAGQQPSGDVIQHNVRYIKDLNELKTAIESLTEDLERASRQTREGGVSGIGNIGAAIQANNDAAMIAKMQGPRN